MMLKRQGLEQIIGSGLDTELRMDFAGFGQYPKSGPLGLYLGIPSIFHTCQWSNCTAVVHMPYLFDLIICNFFAY